MAGESAATIAQRAREKALRLRQEAARLEAYADKWEAGAAGEISTARVLGQLPVPWFAMHDVRWPGRAQANIDHVVVGPGGIYVIDSKNWSGDVTVRAGVLRQNGYSRETSIAGAADAALAVADVIRSYAHTVQPVVCFVGMTGLPGMIRDVWVSSTTDLVRFLLSRPTVLDPRQVQDACMRLDAQLAPAATSPLGIHTNRPRRSTKRSQPRRAVARSPRRRKRGPSLLRFLLTAVLVLLVLATGPQLAAGIGARVTQVIAPQPKSTAACADTHQPKPARQKRPSRPTSVKQPMAPSRTPCTDTARPPDQ